MRIPEIIHQQICQLKWHLLACLGLIMVLPIEEAVVNLRGGHGFHSVLMAIVAVTFSPLLTGLVACANVQGDLEQKRYVFWRSKPANVKLFMALKFFIGLMASLMILACPVVFAMASTVSSAEDPIGKEFACTVPVSVLIAIMTYSLCFGCNVLVRKTARAWLIGMLLTGFLLVLPFALPLDYKDFVSDILSWTLNSYLAIMLVASAVAFALALYAAEHDWHLRTNLKGLLWVGIGLVFVLTTLFSSQVANIKVLQEKEIAPSPSWGYPLRMDHVGDRLIFQGRSYVNIDKNSISVSSITNNSDDGTDPNRVYLGPWSSRLYKKVGNDVYALALFVDSHHAGQTYVYDKVHLRSYKVAGQFWTPAGELDLSDCLMDATNIPRFGMWLFNDAVIFSFDNNCVAVNATHPGELKRIDTKLGALKHLPHYPDRRKNFTIPLVRIEGIGIEEQIRVSIDANHWFNYGRYNIRETSIVDIHDDKISFSCARRGEVVRFDVTGWDEENIYCKFSASRPFTILEGMTGKFYFHDAFVMDGNLYCCWKDTLLVFDVRSSRRIRKVGHFVRMSCSIDDIEILDDGRILLSLLRVWRDKNIGSRSRYQQKGYLCLLENPR